LSLGVWRGALAATLVIAAARQGDAQRPSRSGGPTWSYAFDVGGFVQGNGNAIRSWLTDNAYGATEPRRCTFDSLFRAVCDDPQGYPKTDVRNRFVVMGSIRRTFTEHKAIELFLSMEQAGQVTGRCDDLALPKDPRCTNRFIDVSFGGASFALLAEISRGWLHLGAGPALLLANWDMSPSHLAGVWLDGTIEHDPIPVFMRGQYRYYMSTGLDAAKGFSGFHPSSLFLGLGFRTGINNGGL
jgi:hypothetical protein